MSKNFTAGILAEIDLQSVQAIDLVELYLDSVHGGTQYYAKYPTNVVFDGKTYLGIGMEITSVLIDSALQVGQFRIRLNDISSQFVAYLLSTRVEFRGRRLRVIRVFPDLLSDPTNFVIRFDGIIQQSPFDEKVFEITAYSPLAGLQRRGPKGSIQVSCNWRFGDVQCQIDLEDPANKQTGTVTGGTSVAVIDTARAEADNYWRLGSIEFTSGSNVGEKRAIVSWTLSTTTFQLDAELPFAVGVGDAYTVKRACDKVFSTCRNTYNNEINFGGFPFIPRQVKV